MLVHDYGNNSLRRAKTDKKDAVKLANYGLDHWLTLPRYVPEEDTRLMLKTCYRQYQQYSKVQTMLKNNLISLLDTTFPDANRLFTSPPRTDGSEKWVDFVAAFWHCECVCGLSEKAFTARYQKWCRKHGYNFSEDKALDIYASACGHFGVMPKTDTAKLLVEQAISQLQTTSAALATLKQEMQSLAASLPEYPVVMGMFGVGPTLGPQLMAEIGDVRRFHSKKALVAFAGIDSPPYQSGQMDVRSRSISKRGSASLRRTLFLVMGVLLQCAPMDEPIYQFMNKKRSEGKPYRVYMMASANKFSAHLLRRCESLLGFPGTRLIFLLYTIFRWNYDTTKVAACLCPRKNLREKLRLAQRYLKIRVLCCWHNKKEVPLMSDCIIETRGLTKRYGEQVSVSDLDLHVQKGRIYGLLGRNGAGKTTTMKMLLGLTAPTSGTVSLFGRPLKGNEKHILPRIGSLIESPGFYPNLTGTENLQIFARLRGLQSPNYIKGALELVNLPYRDRKRYAQYSLGMKQRLAIALAVMHDPELLILDEPINGLDPIGIAEVRDFIRALCDERGKTILISSHILSEIALLADDIGIIDHGILLEEESLRELEAKNEKILRFTVSNAPVAAQLLQGEMGVRDVTVESDRELTVRDLRLDTGAAVRRFVEAGLVVSDAHLYEDTLEDYFKRITGGEGIA